MQTMLSTNTEAEAFYAECLDLLVASGIPFLLGGSFAVSTYTGLRPRVGGMAQQAANGTFRAAAPRPQLLGSGLRSPVDVPALPRGLTQLRLSWP